MKTYSLDQKLAVFNKILLIMGGYAFLRDVLGITQSFFALGEEGELIMQFRGCDRANKVKIRPAGEDCYEMIFYRFQFASANRGSHIVAKFENITADQLQSKFEDFTELSLTLKICEKKEKVRLPE